MSAWRYAAACVAGAAHRVAGSACEDHAAVLSGPDDTFIAAVCDGAGSAARGGDGARLACAAFVRYASVAVYGDGWGAGALQAVRAEIEAAAAFSGLPVAGFACTMLGAVVSAACCHFVQVGDGAIAFCTSERDWQLAMPPRRGEFHNETVFVTSAEADAALSVRSMDRPPREIALMTDGVEFLAIRQATLEPHVAFFEHVMGGLRCGGAPGEVGEHADWLRAFLGSPEADARTDDDKTLVIATRNG